MILFNHYAIWPPIPKTNFIKHCRVEILSCSFTEIVFSIPVAFSVNVSAAYLVKLFLLPQRIQTNLFVKCDKPELTRWCLCSLHAGIQMSPNEVVGSRDGCRHSIAEGTVDVPIHVLLQMFNARTALFSHPFA